MVIALAAGAEAATIVVGEPYDPVFDTSSVPFSRDVFYPGGGTRYQQAYAAANFGGGAININSFSFLSSLGESQFDMRTQDYQVYLSTVGGGIDSLDKANFGANVGADNALFASGHLSGKAQQTLTFTGGAPFHYDPAAGSLLIDFVFSNTGFDAVGGNYYARHDAVGVFSRYSNFATGNQGYGLVTQFDYNASAAPEPGSWWLASCAALSLVGFRRVLGK
jgi:hypothetical protein